MDVQDIAVRVLEDRLVADAAVDRVAVELHAARLELRARCLDVRNDEIMAIRRARRGRGDPNAEVDRARRTGRSELYNPKFLTDSEVGIKPLPEAAAQTTRQLVEAPSWAHELLEARPKT